MTATHPRFEPNSGADEIGIRPITLAHAVDDAVQTVRLGRGQTRAWEVLLGILTYFYAKGIYPSDEIANAIANDPQGAELHALAFTYAEPAIALRNFRRLNRSALQLCLARVLRDEIEAGKRVARSIEADAFALDY
jgi:hypothetical protein